jgi:hypothetical protein
VDKGVRLLLFPEVHNRLRQGPRLLSVGCLVIVSNHNYYCCVICKLSD